MFAFEGYCALIPTLYKFEVWLLICSPFELALSMPVIAADIPGLRWLFECLSQMNMFSIMWLPNPVLSICLFSSYYARPIALWFFSRIRVSDPCGLRFSHVKPCNLEWGAFSILKILFVTNLSLSFLKMGFRDGGSYFTEAAWALVGGEGVFFLIIFFVLNMIDLGEGWFWSENMGWRALSGVFGVLSFGCGEGSGDFGSSYFGASFGISFSSDGFGTIAIKLSRSNLLKTFLIKSTSLSTLGFIW